jgi:organic radical activating enzyme
LKGVHFILTYRCDSECDHCFVWSSPKAHGVFTLKQVKKILLESKKLGTVESVSLEGGEPFMYYPIMVKAAEQAIKLGFRVEVVSNCYWASCPEDAAEWLRPLAENGGVSLSLSSDFYHGNSWVVDEVRNAVKAAKELNMKAEVISIKYPDTESVCPTEIEGAKVGLSDIMYKGRATEKLAEKAEKKDWNKFTKCPYEALESPERVHVDPYGYVHVCQGISIGNTWKKPFSKIIQEYDPGRNPILPPLIRGGPAALVQEYDLPHDQLYADACHLCYTARCMLRNRYSEVLTPSEMYGVYE